MHMTEFESITHVQSKNGDLHINARAVFGSFSPAHRGKK